MSKTALEALNRTSDVIANQHVAPIKSIESAIDRAINNGEFAIIATYSFDRIVVSRIAEHFKDLSYAVQVSETPTSSQITIKWDAKSLSKVKVGK